MNDIDRLTSGHAEAAVLASMVLDPKTIPVVLGILNCGSFFSEDHRLIFDAALAVWQRTSELDGLLLRAELEAHDQLDAVGGLDYLQRMIESTPSAANAVYYAEIVAEKARYRGLVSTVERMQTAINEPLSVDEQVERVLSLAVDLDKGSRPAGMVRGPILQCLADIAPVSVKWLWRGRIPLGRITLLVGRPGEGKSFLTTYLAARISTGSSWPDGADCPKGSVILISAEDDPSDTIRPRLDGHNADVGRVHLLSAVRKVGEDGKRHEVMFTLADVDALDEALQAHPDCRLVVVDPIGSFLGGRTDAHRDNEVRSVLAPVARLAEKHGAAVVVVAHRRKSGGTIADDLALGSRAFTGIARAVWHLTRDEQDKNRRLLLPGKNNLAPEGDGLAFTIGGEPPSISWERGLVRMTADEALAKENSESSRPGPAPEARNQAAEWLRDLLSGGPMEAAKIQVEAEAAGYAWRTVHRAKDGLGVKPVREHFGGPWMWRLPAGPASQDLTCHIPENEDNLASWHLRENDPETAVSDVPESLSCQVDESGTIGMDEDQERADTEAQRSRKVDR